MQTNQKVIKNLLSGLDSDVNLWRTQPDKWNLLDIICHLVDEEREDFRFRLKHVLQTPQKEMSSINPVAWITERKYQEQNFKKVLANFNAERKISIDWLNKLSNPKWENFYSHPKLGILSATMFLQNWVAHDYLHIRQIVGIKFHYLKSKSRESLNYAGDW
ncbi:MAG: DinB family protein [Saprospiraceae bacterium]|nr:DinB family protein [Saprospiraceae bacterium]